MKQPWHRTSAWGLLRLPRGTSATKGFSLSIAGSHQQVQEGTLSDTTPQPSPGRLGCIRSANSGCAISAGTGGSLASLRQAV
jgi:hypothetical protein